jgi:hypothetical protein
MIDGWMDGWMDGCMDGWMVICELLLHKLALLSECVQEHASYYLNLNRANLKPIRNLK